MHRYLKLAGYGLPILLISTITFALPFYQSKAQSVPATPLPPKFQVPNVMSPSQFSNEVNTLSQQTNARVAQQVQAAAPKQNNAQPQIPAPPAPPSTESTSSMAPANEGEFATAPYAAPAPTAQAQAPYQPQAAAPPSNNFGGSIYGGGNSRSAPSNQGYSGFGTNQTTQSSQPSPPSNKQNGWQIQY